MFGVSTIINCFFFFFGWGDGGYFTFLKKGVGLKGNSLIDEILLIVIINFLFVVPTFQVAK